MYNKAEANISWDLGQVLAPQQYITLEYINSFLKTYKSLENNVKIILKNESSAKWLKTNEGGNRVT